MLFLQPLTFNLSTFNFIFYVLFLAANISQLAYMSAQNIYLKEVLNQMKTLNANGKATPFSIKFRTYNKFSKTGGALKYYPVAKLVMKEENPNINSINALRTKPKAPVARKNPNHFDNKTRNLSLPSGDKRKINIRYIIEFNNQKVIY